MLYKAVKKLAFVLMAETTDILLFWPTPGYFRTIAHFCLGL